ncbi:MAG: phosphate uptake regulator PhoU [Candidatus Omnitrophica bacterium]|nr:phosphate uptake regulator PhoU [Candidatus Omnitrophota bacterium]
MLKEIIAAWKGKSFMNKVVETFGRMLADAEYVFNHAWEVVMGQAMIDEIKGPLHDKDAAVNEHERAIRRMLAEHLSINPAQDISGCLAMMSLVKDAERIGDYSKNIFDLGVMLQGTIKDIKYLDRLSDIHERITKNFPLLIRAYLDSNAIIADEILKDYAPIKEECNKILQDLFEDELSTRESVATALLSRYLKRINSHVSNIASGIVYPLDKLDFVKGGLSE